MHEWTVEGLLDHIQELLAEPVGGYYNISTRLAQLNQAQRELVMETRCLTASVSLPVVINVRDCPLPADFLSFEYEPPAFRDLAGNRTQLQVTDVGWLERTRPQWQEVALHTGTPTHVLLRNDTLTLYPTPTAPGLLILPYVVDPDELVGMDDVPFNGSLRLNRFAPALAYQVAFINTIGRAPQVADSFRGLYAQQERLMRHTVRSDPQRQPGIRPGKERGHVS
jgi:hypothetical protein